MDVFVLYPHSAPGRLRVRFRSVEGLAAVDAVRALLPQEEGTAVLALVSDDPRRSEPRRWRVWTREDGQLLELSPPHRFAAGPYHLDTIPVHLLDAAGLLPDVETEREPWETDPDAWKDGRASP